MENGNKYEANRKEINIKEEKMKDIKLQKNAIYCGIFCNLSYRYTSSFCI